jgi:hypothetical protein
MSTQDPNNLESAIHRTLRSIPDRRAPAGLERRVLAELNRRAALPWWRKSYVYWPMAVRVGFFAGSAVAAAVIVMALVSLRHAPGASELAGDVGERFAWLAAARDTLAFVSFKVRLVVGAIPPVWLYGVAGTIAACYAALAAIAAATYRTVSLGRQDA